jgi:replicative DNA helicase
MTFTSRPSTNGHAPPPLHVGGSDGPVTPPHNRDAEEAVIGSVFKNSVALADVVTFLKPAHFYHPPYRRVYAAMVALFERGDSIDYHTVAAELEHQGTYQSAGGLVGLAELNVATPTSTHITYYAQIVSDHALGRRFIGAAQHVAELAWDVRQDIDTVRQRSEALVLGAATDTLTRPGGPGARRLDGPPARAPRPEPDGWPGGRVDRVARPGHAHTWVVARALPARGVDGHR